MNNFSSKQLLFLYTISGIVIGLSIPIIVTVIELFTTELTLSLYDVYRKHINSNAYILMDLLPIILGITANRLGKLQLKYVSQLEAVSEQERTRAETIFTFAEKLRNGHLNAQLELIDADDTLGKSLINLRDALRKGNEEEELRRKEDDQRRWATEGIAKFSELLRENSNDMEKMSYLVISNLVKYVNANQGGFFILSDDDKQQRFFQLFASYAYNRKKFSEKKVNWGDGLVGACGLEKKTILIKQVSDSYVEITSGLGRANPRCLLLVPLKYNEEIQGVIEIAAFKLFEQHQIEFIEKLAESIASSIANFKINDRTARLLRESQEQAVKMAQQEDLLRKNLEELQMTQEEAAKQSEEFISFSNSVNHTLIRAEYDIEGRLLYANTKFINKLGYHSYTEVDGRHISMFISKKDLEWFNQIWESLAKGGKHFEDYMKHVTKQGKDLWTMATYTCVRNKAGLVERILFLAIDTTEEKKRSLDFESQIQALNISTIKVEYSQTGQIIAANDKFINAMEYSDKTINDKTIFDFLNEDDVHSFKVAWSNVIAGIPFEGQIRHITKLSNEKWFQATFSAVSDMYGEVSRIIFIAYDITTQKLMEFTTHKQTERLRVQEEKLQQSEIELSRKLEETKREMKRQFQRIEIVKMLNERTLEGMLDAVVSINREEKIDFFNNAAEALWGYARSEVLGEPLYTILSQRHGSEEGFMGNYFKYDARESLGKRIEVFIYSKSGDRIPILMTLSEARIGKEYRLTAFVQHIEVELF